MSRVSKGRGGEWCGVVGWVGWSRVGVGCVWVGYLWSNYECFPISGCKVIDFF